MDCGAASTSDAAAIRFDLILIFMLGSFFFLSFSIAPDFNIILFIVIVNGLFMAHTHIHTYICKYLLWAHTYFHIHIHMQRELGYHHCIAREKKVNQTIFLTTVHLHFNTMEFMRRV